SGLLGRARGTAGAAPATARPVRLLARLALLRIRGLGGCFGFRLGIHVGARLSLLGLWLGRRGRRFGLRWYAVGGFAERKRSGRLVTALPLLDRGDQIALAHPGGAGDAEPTRELAQFREHHAGKA